MFTVYSKSYCPYCDMAKNVLKSRGEEVKEIDVTDDIALYEDLQKRTGHMTVPQIFHEDTFIGGYDDLVLWLGEQDA